MPMFDAYVYLPTPSIPPYEELPNDHASLFNFIHDLYLSHDSIATAAYYLWERAGRPDGEAVSGRLGLNNREADWLQAKMMLEIIAETDFSTLWYSLNEWKHDCKVAASLNLEIVKEVQ